MPITKSGSTILYTAPSNQDRSSKTGVISADNFAICDVNDPLKQIQFSCSGMATNTTSTIAVPAGGLTYTFPSTTGVLSLTNVVLQYAAPANGATVTFDATTKVLILEPAGTIAGATVVLPTAPLDGTTVRFSTTATITTLTLSAGGSDTIVNAAATLLAAGFLSYAYRASTTKWYRIG